MQPKPYTIFQLPNEPILIVHYTGEITAEIHFSVSLEVGRMVEKIPGTIYRISDVSKAHISMVNMIRLMEQGLKGWPGTASDPRVITLVVVADQGNIFLGIEHMLRNWDSGWRIHTFVDIAEALAYARSQLGNSEHRNG